MKSSLTLLKQKRTTTSIQSLQAKAWLLTCFVVWLITSCSPDTTTVSPNVRDLNALEGAVLIDTFSLKASTYWFDSTLASESSILPVGSYTDALTGTTKAEGYFDFGLPSEITRFNANATVDSLVISIPYNWAHAPALPTTSFVELHRLRAPMSYDSIMFTSGQRSYFPEVIGRDTLFATELSSTSGTLRFALYPNTDTLPLSLLNFGKQADFGNDLRASLAFAKRYHGFAIVPVGTQTVVANLVLSSSSMVLHGKYTTSTGSTLSFTRGFDLFGQNRFYSATISNREGSDLANLSKTNRTLTAEQLNNRVYMQNLTALWAKVEFPTYPTFKRNHPEFTLVKAVLELKSDPTKPYNYQGILPRVITWQGNADHLAVGRNGFFTRAIPTGKSSDFSLSSSFTTPLFDGNKDTDTTSFEIDLTSYILAIDEGSVYNSGVLLAAPVGLSYLAPFSFVVDNANKSNPKRARLKTYFVRLNR